MKLVGLKRIDYVSKTGNPVKGFNLFISADAVRKSTDGTLVNGDEFGQIFYTVRGSFPYINDKTAQEFKVDTSKFGKNIELLYNAYGAIDRIIFS